MIDLDAILDDVELVESRACFGSSDVHHVCDHCRALVAEVERLQDDLVISNNRADFILQDNNRQEAEVERLRADRAELLLACKKLQACSLPTDVSGIRMAEQAVSVINSIARKAQEAKP